MEQSNQKLRLLKSQQKLLDLFSIFGIISAYERL